MNVFSTVYVCVTGGSKTKKSVVTQKSQAYHSLCKLWFP